MIIRHLVNRPIAVTMIVIAFIVIGIVSMRYIPISLLPDIDIPQITVQVSYPGASVREMDGKVLRPLRSQLQQVMGLKDITSEARTDAGSIFMSFEPGSNIDLLFIEVNEKLDRAMSNMPEEVERPRVLKASATDIPAFYLDMTLANEDVFSNDSLPVAGTRFTELGDFARNIVTKRLEQLPQTAMVDISGVLTPELLCIPDYAKLSSMGMEAAVLERVIQENHMDFGSLSVADGLYRYNIHFDAQVTTKKDIENLYVKHEGRLFQFKDLCEVIERPARRTGMVRSGKNNAVTMAIIKQNDAQMEDLQNSIAAVIKDMKKEYPDIEFTLTRDQTKLLSYSINNLKNNLLVGAALACLVLFFFMRDLRSPSLIIVTIPLSLIVTLLMFHVLGITLNIISLSGLILGVGMMVDNSIIVIDNITQKWQAGNPLKEAVIKATGEVFTPMLSSVLTTCSVFLPLIFLSGTAGALFYDQAMAVTIALFSSLLVSVLVIPVYFHVLYKGKKLDEGKGLFKGKLLIDFYTPYERGLKWVLRNQKVSLLFFFMTFPMIYFIYDQVKKDRLPYIEHDDALMTIDWNAGISVEENDQRVAKLLTIVNSKLAGSTSMIGVQEFMLSHTQHITGSEAIVYLKTTSEKELKQVKEMIRTYMSLYYPNGMVEFTTSGNIFDMIFSSNEPDLRIALQKRGGGVPLVSQVREVLDSLRIAFPDLYFPPVVVEENIKYVADLEQMSIYGVTYGALNQHLNRQISQQDLFKINQGSYSVPVTLGESRKESKDLLMSQVRNSQGVEVPLTYLIKETKGEDYKELYSGNGGEYYPIEIDATDKEVRDVMDYMNGFSKSNGYYISYGGEYFSSRSMVWELIIVLSVSIALLYFILAAQFESIVQPMIILSEIVIDIFWVLLALWLLGESLNIMSLIGIVVMSGIIINDSILKVDTINRLRKGGVPLIKAIYTGGHSRLKPIIMTSLTTILAIVPFLNRIDMGSALQYPLSLTLIVGMSVGTLVSLFFIPLVYYIIYRKK